MERKNKIKLLNKILDAGYENEKAIIDMGLKDILVCSIKEHEIPVLIELQEATKNHKVISFFSGKINK